MSELTFIYCTNRDKPEIGWFEDSLFAQGVQPVIIVSTQHGISPKPTVWSGAHRLTREDWWSKSNSLNTGIAHCRTKWVSFIDDRCVLLPGYVDCIRRLMSAPSPYVLLGAYEKRVNMTVENGVIKNGGIITGKDNREEYSAKHYSDPRHMLNPPYKAPAGWCYGCSITLPLEWSLKVNGFSELCDGLGGEDYIFGQHLSNAGYPIFYEPRMKMIEDRTPGECGPVARREDKGKSPKDKSHALLDKLSGLNYAPNSFDLQNLRGDALAGKPWPVPTEPVRDWYDGQPLNEM